MHQHENVPPEIRERARRLHETDVPPFLMMKLRESTDLAEDDALELLAAQTTKTFQTIAGSQRLRPPTRAAFAISRQDAETLMSMARSRADKEGDELPDLLKFYARQIPDLRTLSFPEAVIATTQLFELVEQMRQHPLVETAYIESPAKHAPGNVDISDDPGLSAQLYLQSAPAGVESLPLWRTAPRGSTGEGLLFVDVERGWYTDHEDISLASTAPIVGVNKNDRKHGTSVLGIINAVDNTTGIIGIAPRAKGYIASEYFLDPTGSYVRQAGNGVLGAAIFLLLGMGAIGHVIVVESTVAGDKPDAAGTGTDEVDLPVEGEHFNWCVIRTVVQAGLVVVEAAGNGDQRLTSKALKALIPGSVFDFVARSSGAIIVAAGQYTGLPATAPYSRYSASNYGKRVDCFARGDDVYTCGYSPSGYVSFNATSAATAIIAGVAVVTQALALGKWGALYRPPALREMLRGTPGTRSMIGSEIGTMPSLLNIWDRVGLHPPG